MRLYILVYILLGWSLHSYAKPLKILMVTRTFPSPVQIYVLNQVIGLLDLGHDVYILADQAYDNDLQWSNHAIPQKIAQYELDKRTYYKKIPHDIKDFDIVYCQFGQLGLKFLELKKDKTIKTKLVTCFRGSDASSLLRKDPHIYDALFASGDCFVPVCQHFARRLIAAGCPTEKIYVNHSAIDCDIFTYKERLWPEDNIVHIITVARLSTKKGHDYAIKAIAKLYKNYPNIRYTIIGSGKKEKELQQLVTKLQLNDIVTFAGLISHDLIHIALHNAHIFLLPSFTTKSGLQEGIPNALMEAMATGLPVITTYHAGIPELVHNLESGFIVPEKKVNALYRRLKNLIQHQELWKDIGQAARMQVEREHNMHIQNKKLHNLFQQLSK